MIGSASLNFETAIVSLAVQGAIQEIAIVSLAVQGGIREPTTVCLAEGASTWMLRQPRPSDSRSHMGHRFGAPQAQGFASPAGYPALSSVSILLVFAAQGLASPAWHRAAPAKNYSAPFSAPTMSRRLILLENMKLTASDTTSTKAAARM